MADLALGTRNYFYLAKNVFHFAIHRKSEFFD